MTGFAELPVEAISLNPMEQKRLIGVRTEIVNRDKFCTFPIMVRGQLQGLEITAPARYGSVHHITPMVFLQRHRPQTNPNHPLNLITIDGNRHNMIHRTWIERYGCDQPVIKEKVYFGGKAGWVDDYDDALTSIALIRTRDLLMQSLDIPEYFQPYKDEVLELYEHLDQDFESRYRFFAGKVNL